MYERKPTSVTFTLYPVLLNWVLRLIFNKVKLLLCSFFFPVEVACIPLLFYHSWIWLGGVEILTVHFVLFAWVLFVFKLPSEVEGKLQLILFTGITLYSLILRRYQYVNFHLHITIIVQITNQIKSNVGFWGEGKTGIPREKPLGEKRRINKLSPLMMLSPGIKPRPHSWKVSALTTAPILLRTLFAIRVIKMIVPHVVPNKPTPQTKTQENKTQAHCCTTFHAFQIMDDIYDRFFHLLHSFDLVWLDPEAFAEAVHEKGAALTGCWGFIDGTPRPIACPVCNQRIMFSGHKRTHCLKFQVYKSVKRKKANFLD